MKSQSSTTVRSRRLRLVLCAIVTVCTGVAIVGATASVARSATYDDVAYDSTGKAVAYVPEKPWIGPYDVGAKCEIVNYDIKLSVRPPSVFPLSGYGSQYVSWRAYYVNIGTGQVVATNQWSPVDTAYSNEPATFGRIDRVNGQTNIWLNQYWTNSQWFERAPGTIQLGSVMPHIQVAWYTAKGWVYRSMKVDWEETTNSYQTVGGAGC